jgi:hypothetical protein
VIVTDLIFVFTRSGSVSINCGSEIAEGLIDRTRYTVHTRSGSERNQGDNESVLDQILTLFPLDQA